VEPPGTDAHTTPAGEDRGPAAPLDLSQIAHLADTAVNPFCLIRLDGTVLWAGGSIDELLGVSAEQLIGRNLVEYVAPASLEVALESLAAADDYMASRSSEARSWEGVGPSVALVRADGTTVEVEVAVATPLRTGLPGVVLQLRRAGGAAALEDALKAMGRGDGIDVVLAHIVRMLAAEFPEVEVAVAHRCTPDDSIQVVGSPPGLESAFTPGVLDGTPWMAAVEEPDAIVTDAAGALPEPLRTIALDQGFRWLTALGVRIPGPAQHRAYLGVWSRHQYSTHVFSHQRLRRCANLVGLTIQWEEGRRALEWAVTHDGLTGLVNRSVLVAAIEAQAPRDGSTAVLYLDLDDFKPVNDIHGHALGDRVLAEVATRLRHAVRPTDVVARIGGDEFGVLCPDVEDVSVAQALAERLVAAVSEPMVIHGVDVQVGLSVGIAALVEGDDADLVLARADEALRRAKRAGKARWAVH